MWTPDSNDKSPDRMDALVWALTELNTGGASIMALAGISNICSKCGMPSPKTANVCFKCGGKLGE